MPQSIVDYLAIFTFISTVISFTIKVFTHRPTEEVFYDVIHHAVPSQPQSSLHPHNTPYPQGSVGVHLPPYPSTPTQLANPAAATQQPVIRRSRRFWLPHPRLFGISMLGLILIIASIILAPGGTSPAYTITNSLGGLFLFAAWIYSIVLTARERRWGWLIAIIVTVGYGVIFFSIFDRPKKPVVVSSMGMAGSPVKPNAI